MSEKGQERALDQHGERASVDPEQETLSLQRQSRQSSAKLLSRASVAFIQRAGIDDMRVIQSHQPLGQ
jgi:hypothetical protein